ncbi:hypothetical protein BJX64DRAFT_87206 [Aspergillus heterothallicus]
MTMNPYISWAIMLVVAGSLGWYYSETNAKNKSPAKPLLEKTETAPAAKKQKRKAKKSPEPSAAPSEKPVFETKATESDIPDEEIDQKELAKRFAAVKNGTSSSQFASGESKSQKKKKSKATAARQPEPTNDERSASRVSTRTSSTTGADADDDLSSAGSPQVNATVPAAGYVSDMLETPAPGASVLRVTGSVDSDSQKKKTKPQNFKQVETKKQRQQRVKNEARKQQVQEAEEQRRKLLEKQLHTAREAERREAAKSTSAPQTNAWQTKDATKTVNGAPPVTLSPKVELLDTFEAVATTKSPATSQEYQALPSEEEQMRILGAANGQDAWTTVGTKKPKKKGGKTDESEASASESQPIPSAPTPVEPKVKVTPTYLPDILRSNKKGHPLDSDWAA